MENGNDCEHSISVSEDTIKSNIISKNNDSYSGNTSNFYNESNNQLTNTTENTDVLLNDRSVEISTISKDQLVNISTKTNDQLTNNNVESGIKSTTFTHECGEQLIKDISKHDVEQECISTERSDQSMKLSSEPKAQPTDVSTAIEDVCKRDKDCEVLKMKALSPKYKNNLACHIQLHTEILQTKSCEGLLVEGDKNVLPRHQNENDFECNMSISDHVIKSNSMSNNGSLHENPSNFNGELGDQLTNIVENTSVLLNDRSAKISTISKDQLISVSTKPNDQLMKSNVEPGIQSTTAVDKSRDKFIKDITKPDVEQECISTDRSEQSMKISAGPNAQPTEVSVVKEHVWKNNNDCKVSEMKALSPKDKNNLDCHIQLHTETFQTNNCENMLVEGDKNVPLKNPNRSIVSTNLLTSWNKMGTCMICDQLFLDKESLLTHYKNHDHHLLSPDDEMIEKEGGINSESDEKKKVSQYEKINDQLLLNRNEPECTDIIKEYKCFICNKQFSRNSSLVWHVQLHEMSLNTNSKTSESGKENEHVKNGLHKCYICKNSFQSISNLTEHVISHGEVQFVDVDMNKCKTSDEVENILCKICNQKFGDVTSLKMHFAQEHKDHLFSLEENCIIDTPECQNDEYMCDLCDRLFPGVESLKQHIVAVHGLAEDVQDPTRENTLPDAFGQYKCDSCSKIFYSIKAKRIHFGHMHKISAKEKVPSQNTSIEENEMNENSCIQKVEEPHVCHLCNRNFHSRKGLNRHISSHKQNRTLDLEESVSVHLSDAEETEDETTGVHDCPLCEHVFENKKDLNHHIKFYNHIAEFPETVCKFCHMHFKTVRARKIHVTVIHRDAELNDQNQSPQSKIDLKKSERISLKQYNRVSGSIRPIKFDTLLMQDKETVDENCILLPCDFCDKSFGNARGKRVHISHMHKEESFRIDEGQLYVCDVCNKSFASEGSLKEHTESQCSKEMMLTLSDQVGYSCKKSNNVLSPSKSSSHEQEKTQVKGEQKENENLRCSICAKSFVNVKAIAGHMKVHSKTHSSSAKSDPLITADAPKTTINEGVYNVKEEYDEYLCDICKRQFNSKKSLEKHLEVHKKPQLVFTDDKTEHSKYRLGSNHVFSNGKSSKIHVYSYNKDLIRKSQEGEKTESSVSRKSDSLFVKDKIFVCDKCGKIYTSRRAFNNHVKCSCPRSKKLSQSSNITDSNYNDQKLFLASTQHQEEIGLNKTPKKDQILIQDSFLRSSDLNKHLREYRKKSELYQNASEKNPQIHKEEYLKKYNKVKCDVCSESFINTNTLHNHKKMHSRQSSDLSSLEDSNLLMSPTVNDENNRDDDIKPIQCYVCDKYYLSEYDLQKHMESHVGKSAETSVSTDQSSVTHRENSMSIDVSKEDIYACKVCGHLFLNEQHLENHLNSHEAQFDESKGSDVRKFRCIKCGNWFSGEKSLQTHMYKYHRNLIQMKRKFKTADYLQAEYYKCNQCNQVCTTYSKFRNHIYNCTGNFKESNKIDKIDANISGKTLKCKCGRLFLKRCHLQKHLNAGCKKVGGRFSQIVKNNRTKIHLPFKCVCGKSFLKNCHLQNHQNGNRCIIAKFRNDSMIEKKDGKPLSFKCDCGRLFGRFCHLQKHRKSKLGCQNLKSSNDLVVDEHFSEEPLLLKCHCGRSFSNHSHLKRHQEVECKTSDYENNTNIKEECTNTLQRCACGQSFLTRRHLKEHLSAGCEAIQQKSVLMVENASDSPLPRKRARKSPFSRQLYEYESIGQHKSDPYRKSYSSKGESRRHISSRKSTAMRMKRSHAGRKLTFSFHGNDKSLLQKRLNVEVQFQELPHECTYCGKRFKELQLMLEHERTHTGASEAVGPNMSVDNLDVNEHFIIENSKGEEEHVIFEKHGNNDRYMCTVCGDNYDDQLQMVVHVSRHLNHDLPSGQRKPFVIKADSRLLAPYECVFCDERFINKRFRLQHMRNHHVDKIFLCNVCQKVFVKKSRLRFHCRQHISETRHCCELCTKYFSSSWFLMWHVKMAHGTKLDCELCGFQGESSKELTEHKCVPPTVGMAVCNRCPESFPNEQELIIHMQIHDKEFNKSLKRNPEYSFRKVNEMFACNCCNKLFVSLTDVQTHIRLPKKKLYPCTRCNLNFTATMYLELHELVHTPRRDTDLDINDQNDLLMVLSNLAENIA